MRVRLALRTASTALLPLLLLLLAPGGAHGQEPEGPNTKLPSTLRYGSGYLDVPAATVLPHLASTGTLSAFRLRLPAGDGGRRSAWKQDGAVAIGLFDRFEGGLTFQSVGGDAGRMVGGFGRFALLRPGERGLGLAVGGRYVSSPSFDDDALGAGRPQPGRLGFPDPAFRRTPEGPGAGLSTRFTPYGIATVLVPAGDVFFLPSWDLSLSLGYGGGMFRGGSELEHYAGSSSDGWIAGGAAHLDLGENLLLDLIGDYNGFDLNFGAQLDFGGARAGAFVLGWNYGENLSAYRSRKFGVLASLAVCPDGSGRSFVERVRCRPRLIRERASADTVRLPAPPPDTVVVVREVAPPPPPGIERSLCLSTGQSVPVRLTAEGDTLVGPEHVSMRALGSTLVFSGSYAEGRDWHEEGRAVAFDGAEYRMEGPPESLECERIMRIGAFMGVPLFASIDDFPPFAVMYIPVRPGVWQMYLRRSR